MGLLPVYSSIPQTVASINQIKSEWDSLSSLTPSRKNIGILWGCNDGSGTPSLGGEKPEIAAVNRSGVTKGRYTMDVTGPGGGNESCAIGPGPTAGVDYLYFGPNMGGSIVTTGRICRIPEPTLTENGSYQGVSSDIHVVADALDFQFGDGSTSYTCECFLLDPISKDLYIVTKGQQPTSSNANAMAKGGYVFKFPYPQATSGTTIINFVAKLDIDILDFGKTPALPVTHDTKSPARPMITDGDVSPDGTWIVIRTRSKDGWVWKRPSGGLLEDAFGSGAALSRNGAGGSNVILQEGQESCCFAQYKAQGFVEGNNTSDGTPGGIYGAYESAKDIWYNAETQQPDAGGGGPDSTGWLGGVVPIR